MNVSFQGVNDLVVTFQAGEGVSRGDFVKLGANGTVAAASYGDGLVGKVLDVRPSLRFTECEFLFTHPSQLRCLGAPCLRWLRGGHHHQ